MSKRSRFEIDFFACYSGSDDDGNCAHYSFAVANGKSLTKPEFQAVKGWLKRELNRDEIAEIGLFNFKPGGLRPWLKRLLGTKTEMGHQFDYLLRSPRLDEWGIPGSPETGDFTSTVVTPLAAPHTHVTPSMAAFAAIPDEMREGGSL